MNIRNRGYYLSVPLLALILLAMPARAEDPYLQGLKAESNKLQSLGREARKEQEMLERHAAAARPATVVSNKPAAEAKQAKSAAPEIAAGFPEFEKGMRAFPAGFGLYEKLDAKNKQIVFAEYAKEETDTRRYAAAIKKTIELSLPAGK